MKKLVVSIAVLSVLVVTLGLVGSAFAQEDTPPSGDLAGRGGPGRPGGRGGERMQLNDGEFHDLFIAEMAEALNMDADSLNARLEDGERLFDIAAEAGYEGEDLAALMQDIHAKVTEEALAQGLITQEQADQMANRAAGPGGRGGRGGFEQQGNFGDEIMRST